MTKEYSVVILRTPEEMYKTFPVAKCLNAKFTEESYKQYIDDITSQLKFTIRAIKYGDDIVAYTATHRIPIAGLAPEKAATIANIAALPEHRGSVTKFMFAWVQSDLRKEGISWVDIRSSVKNEPATKCYLNNGFKYGENRSWRKDIRTERELSQQSKAKL